MSTMMDEEHQLLVQIKLQILIFFFSMYGSISISVGLETFEIFDLFSQVELHLRDQNRQLNYFGDRSCMCDE